MDPELMPLIKELCFIAHQRNLINLSRHRSRYKKQYWNKALKIVEAYMDSNSEIRKLESKGNRQARVDQIRQEFAYIRAYNPYPKKWMDMGLMKIRSLILKYEGEYAMAKHSTMEYTFRTNDRVKEILSKINGTVVYGNGAIDCISMLKTISRDNYINYRLTPEQIVKYATEYELDLNVEKMLE
jgi:hypothetical protein